MDKFRKLLVLTGRIIFSFPYFFFGLRHFIHPGRVENLIPDYIPYPTFWVYFTGLALILASISMVVNKYARWSGLLLALMISVFVILIYLPVMNKMAILTYTIFIGGSLMVAGIAKD